MRASSIFGLIGTAVAVLIGITVAFGSWYTVDDGYRGVLLRNGAFVSVAEPGLNFKTPWIEEVVHISVRDNVAKYGNDVLFEAYSRDQQIAELKVSVNYRIPVDQVSEVYTKYGSESNLVSRLLDRQVFEKVKTVFGQYTAQASVQERARLNSQIAEAIMSTIEGPLIVSSVQIEDVSFSDAYNSSIEERMKEEVQVTTKMQELAKEKVQYEIQVTQAQARADSKLAEAEAQAKGVILQGNAEAEAISVRGKALRENAGIVGLIQAERWDGKLPVQMIPGSTVPFLNLGQALSGQN